MTRKFFIVLFNNMWRAEDNMQYEVYFHCCYDQLTLTLIITLSLTEVWVPCCTPLSGAQHTNHAVSHNDHEKYMYGFPISMPMALQYKELSG